MIVDQIEQKRPTSVGCFPTLDCLYSTISHDVRMHMERVGRYGEQFLKFLKKRVKNLDLDEVPKGFYPISRQIFMYHDVGRAYIPVRVLNKPEGLTKEEYQLVKQHVNYADQALQAIYYPPYEAENLLLLYEIASFHHERYDGNGYPNQLKGREIPFLARVCAIVDAYDGMTSWKPYRKSMDRQQVITIYEKEAGKQFDPLLSSLFIQFLKESTL